VEGARTYVAPLKEAVFCERRARRAHQVTTSCGP